MSPLQQHEVEVAGDDSAGEEEGVDSGVALVGAGSLGDSAAGGGGGGGAVEGLTTHRTISVL
jgi:hypothetical protein